MGRPWHRPPASVLSNSTPAWRSTSPTASADNGSRMSQLPASCTTCSATSPASAGCGFRNQKPPATSSASTTDAASAKRRAGGACALAKPRQRYFERAAHAAVERQRLIPEAAAVRAGGEVRGDLGRQMLRRRPDVQPRVAAVGPAALIPHPPPAAARKWCAAGCARGTAGSAPWPGSARARRRSRWWRSRLTPAAPAVRGIHRAIA